MPRTDLAEAAVRTEDEPLIDAAVGASRALLAVAARSLAGVADGVSLPQYRVLVELASRGPQRSVDLAAVLGVERSTATRMVDRLVRKRLVSRRRQGGSDRRAVRISLTASGGELVEHVTRRRRAEISAILERMPRADRHQVLVALRGFADAAGEVPEQDWSSGWDLEP
jgi:DNA-binding MarR family transcriptional regulator